MKKVNGYEVIQVFEQWSPKRYALEGDPVGVHIGQLNRLIEKVLITLDVNEAVLDEAIEKGANLIIAHHPPLFRPLKSIATDTVQGRFIEKCIKNDLTIYAAHTNLDIAVGGVNDLLADQLALLGTSVLSETENGLGLGRVGQLAEPVTLETFTEQVKEAFDVPALRFVGDPNKMIKRVAVLGGDGNKYIYAAKRSGADVLVTGDLYYHVAHDAQAIGLAVVDPGHHIEKVMIKGVKNHLTKACAEKKFDVEFIESIVITEPFQFR